MAHIIGNGGYFWQVGQSIGIVCGFNNNDSSQHYSDINYGFYIENKKYQIIESGTFKTSFQTFNVDAVFKVERVDGVVYYYIDDSLVYTSTTGSSGTIFLDCSLYHYDDTIYEAEVYYLDNIVTELNIALEPLVSFSIDSGEIAFCDIQVSPLSVSGEEDTSVNLNISLSPLISFGNEADVNIVNIDLSPLIVRGDDLIPHYALAHIELEPLVVGGHETGALPELHAEFSPLIALGVETEISYCAIELAPIAVFWEIEPKNYLSIGETFPSFTFEIASKKGYSGDITFPRFRVLAGDLQFGDVTFPRFEVEGLILGNLSGDITFPNLTVFGGDIDPCILQNLEVEGTFGGSFNETLKGFIVEGSVITFYEFSADITIPGLVVDGSFGGNAELEIKSFEIEGVLFSTNNLSGDVLLKNLEVVGEIIYELATSADITFPKPIVSGKLSSDSDFYIIRYINPRSVEEQEADVPGVPEYILGYDR